MAENLEEKVKEPLLIGRINIVNKLDLPIPPEADFFGYKKGELRFYKGEIPSVMSGGRKYYHTNGRQAVRFEGFSLHRSAGHIQYGSIFLVSNDGTKELVKE